MVNVVEVGPQVHGNDSRLALHDCLCHSVYRLMRCPFRSISIRPRLEISFKDRLQEQLEGPLDHTITDSRNRRDADFSPVLWNLLLRARMGRYVLVISSSRICLRKSSTPLSSMASNVTPSVPG